MRIFTVMSLAALLVLGGCSTMPSMFKSKPEPVAEQKTLSSSELRIAESALQSGDTDVALSLYTELSNSHPDNGDVWLGLGDSHYLNGEIEQAQLAYLRAAALDEQALEPKLSLARIAIRMRSFDEAQQLLNTVLAAEPSHPVAMASLGVVYDLTNRPELAQQTYKQGLAANPGNAALRSNLGLSLALNGQAREAVNVLLGYSGVSRNLPQARENLALAYGLLGRDDAAEEILLSSQTRGQAQDNLAFYQFLRKQLATKQGN